MTEARLSFYSLSLLICPYTHHCISCCGPIHHHFPWFLYLVTERSMFIHHPTKPWKQDWLNIRLCRWEQKRMANYISNLLTDLELIKHRCLFLPCFLCLPPAPFLLPSFKVIFNSHNSEPTTEDKMANKIDVVPIPNLCTPTERWVLWGKQWCTLGEKNRDPDCVKEIFPELRPRKYFSISALLTFGARWVYGVGVVLHIIGLFCSLPGQYLLDCPGGTIPFTCTHTFENHWLKVWISKLTIMNERKVSGRGNRVCKSLEAKKQRSKDHGWENLEAEAQGAEGAMWSPGEQGQGACGSFSQTRFPTAQTQKGDSISEM